MRMLESICKELKSRGYKVMQQDYPLCPNKLYQLLIRMPDKERNDDSFILSISQLYNAPICICAMHNVKGREKYLYDWQDMLVHITRKLPTAAAKDVVDLALQYMQDLKSYKNTSATIRVYNEDPAGQIKGHISMKYDKWYFVEKMQQDDDDQNNDIWSSLFN